MREKRGFEIASIQIRRWKISLTSGPSGIHMGGLHGCSSDYLLISIVTIQSDLRPLRADLKPSKLRVKTPSDPNLEGHKTKTKAKFISWPDKLQIFVRNI